MISCRTTVSVVWDAYSTKVVVVGTTPLPRYYKSFQLVGSLVVEGPNLTRESELGRRPRGLLKVFVWERSQGGSSE